MGKNQGIIRLQKGFTRRLTPSEKHGQYVYTTMDISLPQILDPEFELFINNISAGVRKLEKHGRITRMNDFVPKFGDNDIHFQTKDRNLYISF